MRYVLGFVFDAGCNQVLLIRKRRPAWQAGTLNGIGGRIEDGDLGAAEAMSREMREETGVEVAAREWTLFAELVYREAQVFCFALRGGGFAAAQTRTDEEVERLAVTAIARGDVQRDLRFLAPLARHRLIEEAFEPIRLHFAGDGWLGAAVSGRVGPCARS
jgi:8-oxo-dGTP diphosphatase